MQEGKFTTKAVDSEEVSAFEVRYPLNTLCSTHHQMMKLKVA